MQEFMTLDMQCMHGVCAGSEVLQWHHMLAAVLSCLHPPSHPVLSKHSCICGSGAPPSVGAPEVVKYFAASAATLLVILFLFRAPGMAPGKWCRTSGSCCWVPYHGGGGHQISCCQRSKFALHFVRADATAEHCAFVHAAATCSKHSVFNIALEALEASLLVKGWHVCLCLTAGLLFDRRPLVGVWLVFGRHVRH
jgi:hypothetical protein